MQQIILQKQQTTNKMKMTWICTCKHGLVQPFATCWSNFSPPAGATICHLLVQLFATSPSYTYRQQASDNNEINNMRVRGCVRTEEQFLDTSCVQLFATRWYNKQDTTNNKHVATPTKQQTTLNTHNKLVFARDGLMQMFATCWRNFLQPACASATNTINQQATQNK